MDGFGKFVVWLVLFICLIISRAYTSMCLWNWFINPLGLPRIDMAYAYGLSTTIAFFTFQFNISNNNVSHINNIATAIAWNLMFLLFGYITYWGFIEN